MKREARVLVIYTGGTIGMGPRDPGNPASPLAPKPLAELRPYIPGLRSTGDQNLGEIDVDGGTIHVEFDSFDEPIDSSDINPAHWLDLARRIQARYADFDGFVVLHGTDTMAYTTSALAFMFSNLAKPVVVTGSQLPISAPRTDALQNLVNSLAVAGYRATGLPRVPEVVLVFWDKILRGCRATKVSASDFDGFASPNTSAPLGRIGEHITIDASLIREGGNEADQLVMTEEIGSPEMMRETHVVDVSLHPAFQAEQLGAILSLEHVRGLVFRTFGTGNAHSDPEMLTVLGEAIGGDSGCLVVNVTQCLKGTVEMGLYAASSGLLEKGVVSGLDLTPEAAFAKLYWTLATQVVGDMAGQMQVDQRGEQTLNLFDLRYGSSETLAGDLAGEAVFTGGVTPDPRFDRSGLSQAVVRLSEVEVLTAEEGESFQLRVFLNKPRVTVDTPEDDPHCVAVVEDVWQGEPMTLIADVVARARSVLGDGPIVLSIVPVDCGIRFDGLYLAAFTTARSRARR